MKRLTIALLSFLTVSALVSCDPMPAAEPSSYAYSYQGHQFQSDWESSKGGSLGPANTGDYQSSPNDNVLSGCRLALPRYSNSGAYQGVYSVSNTGTVSSTYNGQWVKDHPRDIRALCLPNSIPGHLDSHYSMGTNSAGEATSITIRRAFNDANGNRFELSWYFPLTKGGSLAPDAMVFNSPNGGSSGRITWSRGAAY